MSWQRKRIIPIVEGRGEVIAVPRLVERWIRQQQRYQDYVVEDRAICANGVGRLKCSPENQRGVEYFVGVALKRRPYGILIVLDADDECWQRTQAKRESLGAELLRRARAVIPAEVLVSVVVADREFEAWFIEHRRSMAFPQPDGWNEPKPASSIPNCKRVMTRLLGRVYDPIVDQPALAEVLPLLPYEALEVNTARSYRKLLAALHGLVPSFQPRDEGDGETTT